MSLFASKRERRLWFWTLAIVVAIYATLGLAATLAGALGNQALAAGGFLAGMLLVALAVLAQGLKTRPAGIEIGVALGVLVVYFLVFLRTTIPERSHLIEYSIVACFTYEAFLERASHGRWVPAPALLAVLATAAIGTLDECLQIVVPGRGFEVTDIVFNLLAAVLAVVAMVVLRWARRVAQRLAN